MTRQNSTKPVCGVTLSLATVGALAAASVYKGQRDPYGGGGSFAEDPGPEKPVPWWLVIGLTGLAALDLSAGPAPFPGTGVFMSAAAIGAWTAKLNEYGVRSGSSSVGDFVDYEKSILVTLALRPQGKWRTWDQKRISSRLVQDGLVEVQTRKRPYPRYIGGGKSVASHRNQGWIRLTPAGRAAFETLSEADVDLYASRLVGDRTKYRKLAS